MEYRYISIARVDPYTMVRQRNFFRKRETRENEVAVLVNAHLER